MKKINIIKALLIIWLKIVDVSRSVTKSVATNFDGFIEDVKLAPTKFIYHLDNRDGRALQNFLSLRGIVVILYSLQRRRTKYGTYFILPIVNPNGVITACINAEQTKKSRVDIANYILLKAPLTTYVSIPPGLITPLSGMIAAENNATNETEFNAAWFILNPQLKKIMAVVQEGMDADIVHSEIICDFYGFHVKGKGGSHIQHFEGFRGSITGTVLMLAPVGPKGCAYEWVRWDATRTIPTIIKTSTYAHCTLTGQVSNVPFDISVNAIIGEDAVEESGLISVVP